MGLKLEQGDYVPGTEGLERVTGSGQVLQRVLFRLTARRGSFPFLPQVGSRLYLVMRAPAGQRLGLARQYVAEALQEERELTVTGVELEETGETGRLRVYLEWQGESLTAAVELL